MRLHHGGDRRHAQGVSRAGLTRAADDERFPLARIFHDDHAWVFERSKSKKELHRNRCTSAA